MATKKKAKGKTKPKRKKPAAKKAKKPARKASSKKAKPRAKGKSKSKPPSPPARPLPQGKRIGAVTHYFGHVSVAIVRLDPGNTLRVGDMIHIQGHTSDFKQKVESLQVDHAPATEVGPKDDFGLKVVEHAREHDVVYKLKP